MKWSALCSVKCTFSFSNANQFRGRSIDVGAEKQKITFEFTWQPASLIGLLWVVAWAHTRTIAIEPLSIGGVCGALRGYGGHEHSQYLIEALQLLMPYSFGVCLVKMHINLVGRGLWE